MPSLLRLSDKAWPCSREDLQNDNPATWFPPDLADAQPLSDFGYVLPEFTDPPEHDPATHRPQEVRPICIDGTWRQAWELEALPPPPEPEPQPDWQQFRQALITENGYAGAFATINGINPMLVSPLPARLDRFEFEGQWRPFLDSLTLALAALPANPEDPTLRAGYLAQELLALGGRCNLPAAFLEALQELFEEG